MLVFHTVTTTTARRVVEGNDTGTVFATDFVFRDEDSLVVTLVASDGTETVQELNTDYTVEGGAGTVGSVIMGTAPASGETLIIARVEPYTQQTDLVGADPFDAETVETQFDKIVMMIQQLLDLVARAILAPITRDPDADNLTLPDPVDGNILVGRADLTGWDNADPDDVFVTTDFDVLGLPVTIANGGTSQSTAAAMAKGNYLTTTGSGGDYAATSAPPSTALTDGLQVRIQANHTSTDQPTFNLDGIGAKNIRDGNGALLPLGGLQEDGVYLLSYDADLDSWLALGHTRPYVSKLSRVRALTSSTTWTKPGDLDYVEVEVVGGGGGGGGCAAPSDGDDSSAAGGGGGGQYGYIRVDEADLGATETVTVGAAGTAGASGNNSGGNGGASSFGSHITAGGGSGGSGAATNSGGAGGAGGTGGTGGTFYVPGEAGARGIVITNSGDGDLASVGDGGRAGGAVGGPGARASADGAGSQPGGYGGGGSGGVSTSSGTARAGGAGAKGFVLVKEYTFEFV